MSEKGTGKGKAYVMKETKRGEGIGEGVGERKKKWRRESG